MGSHVRVVQTVKKVKKGDKKVSKDVESIRENLSPEFRDLVGYFTLSLIKQHGVMSSEFHKELDVIISRSQRAQAIEFAKKQFEAGLISADAYEKVVAIHRDALSEALGNAKKVAKKSVIEIRDYEIDDEPISIDINNPKRKKHKIKKIKKGKYSKKKKSGIRFTSDDGYMMYEDMSEDEEEEQEQQVQPEPAPVEEAPELKNINSINATIETMLRRDYDPSYRSDVPTIDFEWIKRMEREEAERKKASEKVPEIEVKEQKVEGGFRR